MSGRTVVSRQDVAKAEESRHKWAVDRLRESIQHEVPDMTMVEFEADLEVLDNIAKSSSLKTDRAYSAHAKTVLRLIAIPRKETFEEEKRMAIVVAVARYLETTNG